MIQRILEKIVNNGSFFLCLLKTADKEEDVLKMYNTYTNLDFIDNECYVWEAEDLLRDLHKKDVTTEMSQMLDRYADFTVATYHYGSLFHSVLVDIEGKVIWDPYPCNEIVENGTLDRYTLIYL